MCCALWRACGQASEGTTSSALGGLLGVALGVAGTRTLIGMAPQSISRLDEVSLDGWVFGFAMVIALATGLVFGLLPALRASDPEIGSTLRDGGRGSAGAMHAWRLRGGLVIAELS